MKRCVIALAIWLLLTLFLAVVLRSGMRRAPIFSPIDWALMAALPLGASLTAPTCRWRPLFFIYGCLGGTIFAVRYISVHYISEPLGYRRAFVPDPQLVWILVTGILMIVASGVVCRLAAMGRHRMARPRFSRECCQACGYNLTGNVSGICPECGTAIPEKE